MLPKCLICDLCKEEIPVLKAVILGRPESSNFRWESSDNMKIIIHDSCLNCAYCNDGISNKCWVKNKKLMCSSCRDFNTHCFLCSEYLSSETWIRKFGNIPFHISCFICNLCGKQFDKGDECVMRNDQLQCADHNEEDIFSPGSMSESLTDSSSNTSKRGRTRFTNHQKVVLQHQFMFNSTPNTRQLADLSRSLGISQSACKVWFQNTRSRTRKRYACNQQENYLNFFITEEDNDSDKENNCSRSTTSY